MVIRLQTDPIRPEELFLAVAAPGAGAVATFFGIVRDENRGRKVLRLEYHAYEEMARSEMERIGQRARDRFQVSRLAIVHRTGPLEIGAISVAVAVAAAHRAEAFEACRFVIDALKETVPIWKKETFEGGEVWIEGAGESPRGNQP